MSGSGTARPAEEFAPAQLPFGAGIPASDVACPTEAVPREDAPLEGDLAFMELALAEAQRARDEDEVPIGAVVVLDGRVVGRGHNRTRALRSPLAHAEMAALDEAFRTVGDARLVGAEVYTTVEPCFMCAGALSHARVARVVWAVRDPKFGGAASLGRVLTDERLNHRASVREGVHAERSRELLQTFFREKRADGAARAEGRSPRR